LRYPHPITLEKSTKNSLRLSQNRVSEIIGNTKFGNIDNLLSQGHDMKCIAKHYNMDLPLARPPRLRQCRWRAGLCITIRMKK